MLSQQGEELLLAGPDDGVVLSLVHAGLEVALRLADLHNLFHLVGGVVGQAEELELSFGVGLVHGLQGLLERRGPIRPVQVLDLNLRDLELGQGQVDICGNLVPGVAARSLGEDLGVDGELLSLLDRADPRLRRARGMRRVQPGGIDLASATLVESVKNGLDLLGSVEPDKRVTGLVSKLAGSVSKVGSLRSSGVIGGIHSPLPG